MASSKNLAVWLTIAGLAPCLVSPVLADCTVVSATNSGRTHAAALEASQAAIRKEAEQLKQKNGWTTITSISAERVEPEPFWKMVRPKVPPEIIIKPDIRTEESHSVCWPGVVVPFVCTSGSNVCGN